MKEKNKFRFFKYLKTILSGKGEQEFYKSEGIYTYRPAQDPVVKAFVLPKILKLKKLIDFSKNQNLLDVGCGNGTFTYYFNRDFSAVGVDNSKPMLDKIRKEIQTVQADAENLPFKNGAFDIVFEANVLHHINDSQAVINEITRLNSKYIVFLEPNSINPFMFLFALLHKPDRNLLKLNIKNFIESLNFHGYENLKVIKTGMIFQNATPRFLLPFLKIFDFNFLFGAYILFVFKRKKL